MQKYRRRKKLIKPRLQLKFALIFLSTAGTAVLVQAIMLTHTLTNLAYGAPNDGRIVLQQLPKILSLNLGITFALLIPLTICIGVLSTFRVAGPVYRFEQYLKQVIRGEKPADCRLRKGDELMDICELINTATAPLRRATDELARDVSVEARISPAETPVVEPVKSLI
jgi:hypothetical protein